MNTMVEALVAPLRWPAPVGALAVVLLAVGAAGVQAQTAASAPPAEYHLDDVEVEVDSRGCGFGLCARYRLTLRGDGRMTVAGREYTVETGDATESVERSEIVAVLEALYQEDFFRLADEYLVAGGRLEVSDDGRVRYGAIQVSEQHDRTITVRIGSYSKSVKAYDGIPEAFLAVERRILTVPGVAEWLEMPPRGRR